MADFAGELLSLGLNEEELGGEILLLIQEAPLIGEQVILCTSS